MALRISKNELKKLKSQNASANRKNKRLQRLFGLSPRFQTRNASTFTSRKEFNAYKKSITHFLRPTTEKYYKGGTYLKNNELKFYPIPRDEYREIQKALRKRNRLAKRQQERFKKVSFTAKNEKLGNTGTTVFKMMEPVSHQSSTKLKERFNTYFPLKFQPSTISSKRNLDNFKDALNYFQNPESIKKKWHQAHLNYMDALRNTFGSNAEPIIDIIADLSDYDFISFFESDEFVQFGYIYDPEMAKEALQIITQKLLSFLDEQKIKPTEEKMIKAKEVVELDSWHIISEYNKGSKGGQRIVFNNGKNYIDLSDEEWFYMTLGVIPNIFALPDFDKRVKQLSQPRGKITK